MAVPALALLFASSHSGTEWRARDPRLDPARVQAVLETLPDDASIVSAIRAGDDTMLERLFVAHASGLVAFAGTYLKSDDLAWEIVQDVFLWLMTHRGTWTVPGTVRAYLYSATRHRALNHLKHSAVERRWAEHAKGEMPARGIPAAGEQALISAEQRRALLNAVSTLAESRRTALALRYGHELSYAEIANVLGSSVKAVENQLNRTLRQLRALLEGAKD